MPRGLLRWVTTLASSSLLLGASYLDVIEHTTGRPLHELQTGRLLPTAKVLPFREASPQSAASPKSEAWVGETLSVVLPCAFEGIYASKTVESVFKHTRRERLKEIIVVDDGSNPRLELSLASPLQILEGTGGSLLRGSFPVRLLRHEKTLGLIAAKKTGGDAARGDVIVFFDCHVKPRDGWEDAFLRQMHRAGDHRTMVVPTITALNPDTWEETNGAASQACYMMWNADFTWLTSPGRDVPIMSGGLLALSKRWWEETEGYDERMVAWGGENIDQSLRSWLCGGRIEVAEGAYVAHMWREPSNPKTQLKYPMHTEDVMRNKARAVSAWLGPFSKKALSFPEYEAFTSGEQTIGDLGNFDRLKEKLQCAPFTSYIQRFSYVYLDSGLIPDEIFQVREVSSGLCLEREAKDARAHAIVVTPCVGVEGASGVLDTQLWHLGNRDRSRPNAPCCSGLMNWDFLQCLSSRGIGEEVSTEECAITGHSAFQEFRISEGSDGNGQLIWRGGAGCLSVEEPPVSSENDAEAALAACSVHVEETSASSLRLRVGRRCITAKPAQDPEAVTSWELKLKDCDDNDEQQVFSTAATPSGLMQVRVAGTEECLDSASGSHLLVYPCYTQDAHNPNQAWKIRSSRLVWEASNAWCVDAETPQVEGYGDSAVGAFSFRKLPSAMRYKLSACANKEGQRLQKYKAQADGTFLLRDVDLNQCLAVGSAAAGALETPVQLKPCDRGEHFRELKERYQVQHVRSQYCFDAGVEDVPILYPCHQPKAGRKQRFQVVDSPGWLQLMRGWEDNGRKRFFERCLDRTPQQPARARIRDCEETEKQGTRWQRINIQVPPEAKIWQSAKKPEPGSAPLGGDAAPPE